MDLRRGFRGLDNDLLKHVWCIGFLSVWHSVRPSILALAMDFLALDDCIGMGRRTWVFISCWFCILVVQVIIGAEWLRQPYRVTQSPLIFLRRICHAKD